MQLKSAVKNSFFGVLGQVILIAVGFFCQRAMNLLMGAELVGMNGVISNIIAILSVSEMGVATAIVYNLYSAISRQDEREIAALMNFYRRAYYVFALVILLLGLAVLPFVHLVIKTEKFDRGYVQLVFILWLARTVLSYLLSYKRSMLIADQQGYIVSIAALIVNVANYSSTILILNLTKDYVLALGVNIAAEVLCNLWLTGYVNRRYPFLVRRRGEPLQQELVADVIGNVKNIFVMRLFSRLLLSTDNLIISRFISTAVAGLYSNYCLVTQSLINICVSLMEALKPTLGHLFLRQDREQDAAVLRQVTFLFFLGISTASVCVCCLITPFVGDFWLNEEYLMDMGFVAVYVAQFFFITIGFPLEAVMSVTGLFDQERNVSILVSAVNLAVSLLLVKPLGIIGVLLGTIAAYLVQTCFRMRIFFEKYVGISGFSYLMDVIQYAVLTYAETFAVYRLAQLVYRKGSFLSFVLTAIVCAAASVLANGVLYCRSRRLRSIVGLVRTVLSSDQSSRRPGSPPDKE